MRFMLISPRGRGLAALRGRERIEVPDSRSSTACSRRRARRTSRRRPEARGSPRRPSRRCGCARGPSRSGSPRGSTPRTIRRGVSRSAAVDAGLGRRALERPRGGAAPELVRARRVRGEETRGPPLPFSKSQRMIASATGRSVPGRRREVQVGAARRAACAADRRRRAGRRARRASWTCGRMWMPGRGRVDAPQHDQARVRVVLERDPRHLSVEAGRGAHRRRRADRAREARRAEPREEPRVGRVLREVAVRAAVGERAGSRRASPRSTRSRIRDATMRRAPRPSSPGGTGPPPSAPARIPG